MQTLSNHVIVRYLMTRRLSTFFLFLILFTLITSHTVFASQASDDASYFSFIKNYLIAFTIIDAYNKQVLGAYTKAQAKPTITQITDISAYLLRSVNAYRTSMGLYPVQSNAQVCSFAATRAQEIAHNFSHDGFNTRVSTHTLPYPKWDRATENIAEAPDYKEIIKLWAHSPGHAANMRDNTPFVCIKQYGNYYAYEGMRI